MSYREWILGLPRTTRLAALKIAEEADAEVAFYKKAEALAREAYEVNERYYKAEVARIIADRDALREALRDLLAEMAEDRADRLINECADKGDEALAVARAQINTEKEKEST